MRADGSISARPIITTLPGLWPLKRNRGQERYDTVGELKIPLSPAPSPLYGGKGKNPVFKPLPLYGGGVWGGGNTRIPICSGSANSIRYCELRGTMRKINRMDLDSIGRILLLVGIGIA